MDQVRRAALLLVAGLLVGGCSDDNPGPASASSAATGTEPSTSTTAEPEPSAIALRGDGLGVVDLGAPPAAAVAAVAEELGDPEEDSGWRPTTSDFTTCPGERVREVRWGTLALLFTDGSTGEGTGEHLFEWLVSGPTPPIATAEGLGYGATAGDAEELYEGMVERVPAEDPFPAFLRIAVEGGEIIAYLDETDTITNLSAGTSCGE